MVNPFGHCHSTLWFRHQVEDQVDVCQRETPAFSSHCLLEVIPTKCFFSNPSYRSKQAIKPIFASVCSLLEPLLYGWKQFRDLCLFSPIRLFHDLEIVHELVCVDPCFPFSCNFKHSFNLSCTKHSWCILLYEWLKACNLYSLFSYWVLDFELLKALMNTIFLLIIYDLLKCLYVCIVWDCFH